MTAAPARGLGDTLLRAPIAHRGLHDADAGRPENTLAAFAAARDAGYAVELDVRASADGAAVVFHDDALDRLTDRSGPVSERSARELAQMRVGDAAQTIPTLAAALATIGPGAAVFVEIKPAGADARFFQAVYDALRTHPGPAAVMSFSTQALAQFAALAPELPLGLVSDRLDGLETDVAAAAAQFVSLQWNLLDAAQSARASFGSLLCWTVRSEEAAVWAQARCDQITFENFAPPVA